MNPLPKQLEYNDTIVCYVAQEAGTPHREYIGRKKETLIFTHMLLQNLLSELNQIFCRDSLKVGNATCK